MNTQPEFDGSNVVPMNKPAPSYVAVTPEIAQRWLAGNGSNRNLRAAQVSKWAREMRSGHWTFSNDAICFTSNGKLLNGQHRLNAVVATGITVTMLVIRSMPEESMSSLDTGAARTASDALAFDGEHRPHVLAATLKLCLLIDDGRIYRDAKMQGVSHNELRDYLEAHPGIRESVAAGTHACKHVDATGTMLSTAHWLIAGVNGNSAADEYLIRLSTRANEPVRSPILAVDKRLRSIRGERTRVDLRQVIYLLIKGWNHLAAGTTAGNLTLNPRGEFRIPAVARRSSTQ